MICIPLGDCVMQELLRNLRQAAKTADLLEVRADTIPDFSLARLLKHKINTPLIFTCYAKSNGGCFNGAESGRIALLSSAISSGRFEYVTIDVPEELNISGDVKALIVLSRRLKSKVILAYHNYRRTPDNLDRVYKALSAYKPAAVKIVTYARQFSDNFKIFKLAQKAAPRRGRELISFSMGDKGFISRILYRKFGLFLTYASYKTGWETADGQIPLERIKYLYRADAIARKTEIFGLLGNPIKHSRSPAVFNGLFKAENHNAVYLPFDIEPRYLNNDFRLIKSFLKPAGFSVTSPYKIRVMKLIDGLSKSAKEIGAVNTVYRQGGKYVGSNTDWIGVIEALLPLRKLINRRQAFILGRGGASRAIVYALRCSGIETLVFARKSGGRILPLKRLPQYCHGPGTDKIIINATPVGMFPDTNKSPVPKSCLKKGMIVFDTIYNPAETRLIKDARSKGCFTVNGLRMFLTQGLKQMECFTRNLSR